jgi:hypothetical protein
MPAPADNTRIGVYTLREIGSLIFIYFKTKELTPSPIQNVICPLQERNYLVFPSGMVETPRLEAKRN